MPTAIHPDTTIGAVYLIVADLNRSLTYYQQNIGLRLLRREGEQAYLGAGDEHRVVLAERPGARPTRGTTGLYHLALLVPSRLELARTLNNLSQIGTPISGFADHAVSEAIYLTDPDGHGIEIYRDRPRREWEYPQGQLKMTVDPFDTAGVLAELEGHETGWYGLHRATMMGHIHLHVADIPAAERFYVDILGFELMARYGTAASFVAAGGYHHHIGFNTWAGAGAPPPPPDSAHLKQYEIRLPDKTAMTTVVNRIEAAGITLHEENGRYHLNDPSGNGIVLINFTAG